MTRKANHVSLMGGGWVGAAGFILLLAVLLFSLRFIHREVERLAVSEEDNVQWTDSLIALLREKDTLTLRMLQTLSKANEAEMMTTEDIEQIIARQDTVVAQQRVQRRVVQHRDTVVSPPSKKGFFRRLKEVFVPSKKDSVIEVKTSLEYAVDTVIDTYNPADSLQESLRVVARQKQARQAVVRKRNRTLQHMDQMLSTRIDSLLKNHEQETLERARAEAEYRKDVQRRSAHTVGGIAVGAVLLSAFFLVLIGRAVARDNRYRRQLEEARQRAEDLLAIREKLMLTITHDFKAPLGSIIGYADLLAGLTVDERQRFYLDNVKASSEHLLKLVVDLLDFHRLDLHKAEVHPAPFCPARLMEEIRVSFEPITSAKGLALHCEVDAALEATFRSDALRLRQIIGNLLSNAVKFTDQGSVSLTARLTEGTLTVAVADTGKGMRPADRERIFQEFTRLPDAQGKEGFGLGLSIVSRLVQLLEGSIEVDSTLGKGSTFTVHIPLEPCDEAESVQPVVQDAVAGASIPPSSAPAVRNILMIDDDRIQLDLNTAMLEQGGIRSVACQQVDELLDALRTDRFDALLTDVQMPAINGFDLLQLLRSSNIPQAKSIPIIAVTARSDMQRDTMIAHGFAGCLHKPFTVAELLRELHAEVSVADSSPVVPSSYAAALTAYTGDDEEAARAILQSFVSETRLHLRRLKEAAVSRQVDEASAVAHKMIPLFTLIGASGVAALLRKLEAAEAPFTDELAETVAEAVRQIEPIVEDVEKKGVF